MNQAVSDPEIIALCGKRKHILITADKRLEYTYAPEIRRARIGVVILSTNNDGAENWQRRLITAQESIREQISKRRKPYVIRVAKDGQLTLIKLYRKNADKTIHLY